MMNANHVSHPLPTCRFVMVGVLFIALAWLAPSIARAGVEPGPSEVLKAFLKADSVDRLLPLVADRKVVEPDIRAYYKNGVRKAVVEQGFELAGVGEIPGTEFTAHLFMVRVGGKMVPASVEGTKDGFKVDWPSFTQFHDQNLEKFLADPDHGAGEFRVQLRRSHYFGNDIPDIDRLVPFRVQSPIAPFDEAYAFVDKESEVGKQMLKDFEWSRDHRPVVELKWSTPPDADGGSPRIELVRVVSPKWRG